MQRRHLLATGASAFASSALAGCVTGENGTDSTTEQRTRTTARTTTDPSEEPWNDSETTTESFPQNPENEPDPSQYVRVANEGEDGTSHAVALEVYHEDAGEIVHDRTHTIDAGESKTVYDTTDAEPTGIDSFEVTCAFDDQERTVGVETNECYGWAEFVVTADDELLASYTIC